MLRLQNAFDVFDRQIGSYSYGYSYPLVAVVQGQDRHLVVNGHGRMVGTMMDDDNDNQVCKCPVFLAIM